MDLNEIINIFEDVETDDEKLNEAIDETVILLKYAISHKKSKKKIDRYIG